MLANPTASAAKATDTDHPHFAWRARYVVDYGRAAVKLLQPKAGEVILDIGCGDGSVSAQVQAAGARVIGIDIDPAMAALALEAGIDAKVMDGCALGFERVFDGVFSNAALHFMPSDVVIGEVARVLKPDGRFVAEMGCHGNIAAITTALIAILGRHGIDGGALIPWHFPTADEYCSLLEEAGFSVESLQTIHRPTLMPEGFAAWIDVLGQWFLDAFPADQREDAKGEAVSLLSHSLKTSSGQWMADYTHLRFRAHLNTPKPNV